jgi:hypothetical protein
MGRTGAQLAGFLVYPPWGCRDMVAARWPGLPIP